MSQLIKIVLVGPTGAGKSQFCNFIHNDLTNSIYKVSNSLNSCTSTPQSSIIERQNIRLELIDSPGSSDSNNNDEENLKVLANYLQSKNEIHQILLILSFEDRLSKDTRQYLKILSWIFTPMQFMSNLIVIFTHYPKDPDEEDIEKFYQHKYEINEELNKIFDIPSEYKSKIPQIPVYHFNTKVLNKNTSPHFEENSIKASNDLINDIKFRITSSFYKPINTTNLECNKDKILFKVEQERKELLNIIEELKKNKEKREKLQEESKIEEQKYNDILNHMQSHNRSTLNSSGINSITQFLVAVTGVLEALSNCNIF
jgi:GTPase Era involved in 16S rRNA processing